MQNESIDRPAIGTRLKLECRSCDHASDHLPLVTAPISSNRLPIKRVASARVVGFMAAAV
jgi:hypothetical protein